jgi:predicted ATP-dependent protease
VSAEGGAPLGGRRPDLALTPDRLRGACPVADVASNGPPARVTSVGQERALAALELGLALRRPGNHVYVYGPDGTGRADAVREVLERLAPTLGTPSDRAYVHRFDDAERPRLLSLPPGAGGRLAAAVEEFRRELRTRLPALLENRELEQRRDAVGQRYAREDDARLTDLRRRLADLGMGLVQVAVGPGMFIPDVAPLRNGEPVPVEQAEEGLAPKAREELRRRLETAQLAVHEHVRTTREQQRAFARETRELVGDAARTLVTEELREAREVVAGHVEALDFLTALERDAIATAVALSETPSPELLALRLSRYEVNVIADRTDLEGAPVLFEDYPTLRNLIGAIERVGGGGTPFSWVADASTIRAGSLVRADGGFLVVRAADVLAEPGAWQALKRAALSGKLEPGAAATTMLGLPRSLEPDPVPLDLKLVLIGDRTVHDLLFAYDPDFRELFGIRAEFAPDLPRTPESVRAYAALVRALCERERLPAPDDEAVAAVVEEAAVLSGRSDRLTARVDEIARVLREAAHVAGSRGAAHMAREDLDESLRRRRRRDGALEERLQELALEGTLLIETRGSAVGQVNALAVYDLGYASFGKPTRITASASPGRGGIVNVEREARLSGGVYDKGMMIIAGYLRRLHADEGPLPITASLTFEQSYAGVDGDSASIAEVVALVSEIGRLPVDNRIAVTGSINQHGQVQPVGAVNEKVRAWHALCAAGGDDACGVVIPAANVHDLMLEHEIVEAARAGRFTVFAVASVDEALEVALGTDIATIRAAVHDRLRVFAEALRQADAEAAAPLDGEHGAPRPARS